MKRLLTIIFALAPLMGWAQTVQAPEFNFDGDNLVMTTGTANASIFYGIAELSDLTDEVVTATTNSLVQLNTYYDKSIEVKSNVVIKAVALAEEGNTTVSSDTTILAYGYTLWVALQTAMDRGNTVYAKANGNKAVDSQLLSDLQWAIEEGEMMMSARGSAPYFEAEHFAQTINDLCDQIEAIIGTDEPYAVLSNDNTVLTFYYDDQKTARGGMSVGPFSHYQEMEWNSVKGVINTVTFDTSFADYLPTSTDYWFDGMYLLNTIVGIENLHTQNVTSMKWMFDSCSSLTSLDLSHFNTENVTNMDNMFWGMSQLTELKLDNFNTEKVTSMDYMFAGCTKLQALDLSSFNTAAVEVMSGMFNGCAALTTLDLSSFNTTNVTSMHGMFQNASALKTIYVGNDWSTASVTTGFGMFENCTALVGGAGTFYDANHADYTYAHIDEGKTNSGYFTAAGAEPYTPVTVPLINNEDMEGSDNSNFYYRNLQQAYDILPIELTAGVGVDGSRGIKYEAAARQTNTWDNQVYFHLNQPVSAGTRFKLSFDYRADQDAIIYIAAQSKIWDFIWDWTEPYIYPTTEWQTYTIEGVIAAGVSTDQKPLDTFALSLNEIDGANTYYFDNVKFEAILTDPCPKPTFTTDVNDLSIHSPFGATLHYTVDGSEPTTSSATFTAPLSLTQNTVVKAIAVLSGYENSEVATYQFTPGATFDDYGVLTVEGTTTMTGALDAFGGKNVVAEKITAIVWNSTETIKNTDMQGIDNPNLLVYVNDASLVPGGIQNVVVNGVASEIILTDAESGNNNWYCPQPFTAQKISYTRDFQQQTQIGVSRGWETIALPFDVQTVAAEDTRVITPFGDDSSSYHFWLRRLTSNGLQSVTQIEANTPYLISMPNSTEYPEEYKLAGKVTFSAENASVPESNLVFDESADFFMAPVFESLEAQQHIYALNVGEERAGHPEGSVFEQNYRELRPFEAFTKHLSNGGARFLSIEDMLDGGVTGIEELKNGRIEGLKSESWYGLNGRRVLYPTKGVYIKNGRKVVIK